MTLKPKRSKFYLTLGTALGVFMSLISSLLLLEDSANIGSFLLIILGSIAIYPLIPLACIYLVMVLYNRNQRHVLVQLGWSVLSMIIACALPIITILLQEGLAPRDVFKFQEFPYFLSCIAMFTLTIWLLVAFIWLWITRSIAKNQ